ncbi:hypothetical protein M0208_18350 [Sphingomonas sp. SUN019]|uniref:hypothetical protein n=1 Tax=Sphingomonas sp. SUN019 TaxID=2937788 RepID=UPI002164556B|nr:hypothetical protein [Sphingomonas sp. SUN019]UVO52373.1 hypothetical protein M0208_18350 [Sphingomonas sp. SUN019]
MAGFKRKVFYVGGFDPRGVRFYQQLLAEQMARWSDKTGEVATQSRRRKKSAIRSDWTIRNETRDVTTEYSFLRWEDIVSAAWIRNPLALAARAIGYYRGIARNLDMAKAKALGIAPLITLFYPPILTILLPLLIALPVWGIAAIWLPWWVALLIGLVAGVLLARPLLTRVHAPWLLRFFIFNGELSADGATQAAVDARLDEFADEIVGELDGAWDEVLLITHSNGSILAVSLMNRLLDRMPGPLPANFALVTMGHCIPLIACRRDATRFHGELRRLGTHDFRWIDVGSPPDGAAYFGVNPMLIVGAEARPRMELLSPRFHLFYEPATYHKGYANKYEIHFDYLRTGDRVSPIDYPSLMASPRTIDQSVAEFRAIG